MVNYTPHPPLTGGCKTVPVLSVRADWLSGTMHPDKEWLPQLAEFNEWSLEPDWFDYGLSFEDSQYLDQVIQAVSLALGCYERYWYKLPHGGWGYRQGVVGPEGAMVLFDAPMTKDQTTRELKERHDIFVTLSGKPCALIGSERMCELIRYIDSSPTPTTNQKRGRLSRVDLALDDFERVVGVPQVVAALKGPEAVSRARKGREMIGFDVGSAEITGETAYLGAPSSDRRLRVYDKTLESGGVVDSVRWELQFRDKAAQGLAYELGHFDWGELFASQLVSFVDFRDPESHSEVEKRTRLSWYQRLVGLAEKATAALPKPIRTVRDVLDWLDRSIGPSLAMVVDYFGDGLGVLTPIINSGRERLRPKHQAMIAGTPLGP